MKQSFAVFFFCGLLVRFSACVLVAVQVASAIAFMHSKNISHRDLKTGNILLAGPSDNFSVRICDFGLSKVRRRARARKCRRTTLCVAAEHTLALACYLRFSESFFAFCFWFWFFLKLRQPARPLVSMCLS